MTTKAHRLSRRARRALFAVVHKDHWPLAIVKSTGTPVRGASLAEAEYAAAKRMWPGIRRMDERVQLLLLSCRVVPLTPELYKQYEELP